MKFFKSLVFLGGIWFGVYAEDKTQNLPISSEEIKLARKILIFGQEKSCKNNIRHYNENKVDKKHTFLTKDRAFIGTVAIGALGLSLLWGGVALLPNESLALVCSLLHIDEVGIPLNKAHAS